VRYTIIIWLALALTGCAGGPYEWKYGHDKIVPGKFTINGDKESSKEGAILTWPSHAVDAIIYPEMGKACIQSAQSAKARNTSGNGSVKLTSPEKSSIDLALAQAVVEAVSNIQDKNDVATFADVSLFQVCTIAANTQLTSAETMKLVEAVMAASVEIAKARPQTKLVDSKPLATTPAVPDQAKADK